MSPAAAVASARAALEGATARLARAGVATPRVDAEWLLAGLLGAGRAALGARLDEDLPPGAAARYEVAVGRRERREPLQHVLGWEEFSGLRVAVTPAALIPRPETETLAELALALLPPPSPRPRLVVDVGTGTGCVACALATARPDVRVLALDVSEAAARLARRNAHELGLAGRVLVAAADLLAGLGGLADLIVANLPYLPTSTLAGLAPEVVAHEPRLALDGGPDGLRLIRPLIAAAPVQLAPGGAFALETAGGPQADAAADLVRAAGLAGVSVHRDLTGVERFVTGVNPVAGRPPRHIPVSPLRSGV